MNNNFIDVCANEVRKNKYFFIPELLMSFKETVRSSWDGFKDSWNNLELDTYMGDKGRYRYRRYSVLSYQSKTKNFVLEKHQPHYQGLYYNNLNGGIQRYYAPFEEKTLDNACFKSLLEYSTSVFNELKPNVDWHIEAHQFRITCGNENIGFPTPEGIHRDGRQYILMVLVDKVNVTGGATAVYDLNKNKINQLTLDKPSDALLVYDEETMHGVTGIKRIQADQEAYRDVLVITYIEKDKFNHE